MMKLMVLTISIHPCNISGFPLPVLNFIVISEIEFTKRALSFTKLVGSQRNFAIIFIMSKQTKKSAVTTFYLL